MTFCSFSSFEYPNLNVFNMLDGSYIYKQCVGAGRRLVRDYLDPEKLSIKSPPFPSPPSPSPPSHLVSVIEALINPQAVDILVGGYISPVWAEWIEPEDDGLTPRLICIHGGVSSCFTVTRPPSSSLRRRASSRNSVLQFVSWQTHFVIDVTDTGQE